MGFKVRLPTHTYLKKFLLSYYNVDPIPIESDSWIGITLFSLLSKEYNPNPYSFRQYGDEVTFVISQFLFKYSGSELSEAKVRRLNELIDSMFREIMYKSVDLTLATFPLYNERRTVSKSEKSLIYKKDYRRRIEIVMKRPEMKDCIMNFMELHGLTEDDIKYDTLKKDYYRYRMKGGKRSKIFC